MESPAEQSTAALGGMSLGRRIGVALAELRWAAARLLFFTYIAFALITVVGGLITAPIMTWYFFSDWRFWRHWNYAKFLFPHGYRMFFYMLRGEGNGGFMLRVPLTAPPASRADESLVELAPTWEFEHGCGPCNRCCTKIHCPVLDPDTGLCRGYDSFFWRYFNCGRFPSAQREIDFYICRKWTLRETAPRWQAKSPQKAG